MTSNRPGGIPLKSRGCLAGLVFGALGLLFSALARLFPAYTEALFSRGLYPWIAGILSRLSGWVPFSLGEWLIAGLAVCLILILRGAWRRARVSGRSRWAASGAAGLSALGWAGWIYGFFLLAWGFNYSRIPTARVFGLSGPTDRSRAEALVQQIGQRMDALRKLLAEDDRGVVVSPMDLAALDRELEPLQSQVLKEQGLPAVPHGRVKQFLCSPLLLRWGVSGVYSPFTGEPNVVIPAAPGLLPAVAAHERAHLSGLAHEEDASYLALLTTWNSNRAEVRYSGWLSLWLHLGRGTKERSPGVVRDLRAIQKFFAEHRGRESGSIWKMYSGYLKSQGVPGGTQSYGRVTSLALRHLDRYGMPRDPLVSWTQPLPPIPLR